MPSPWPCRWTKPLDGAVWVLQVGTWSAKIQVLAVTSLSHCSITIIFPVFQPCRFLCNPYGGRLEWGLLRRNHSTGGSGCSHWDLFTHWRNSRLRGDLFSSALHRPGEEKCDQCVAATSASLSWSLWCMWWYVSLTPMFWDFLSGVLIIASC